MQRLILDASILLRAVKPSDDGHNECVELFKILHDKVSKGIVELYEPPEFLLESASAMHRQKKDVNTAALNYLSIDAPLHFQDIVFVTQKDVTDFIKVLQRKYGDQAFKTKTAADIIYLILSWRIDALLITADEGLLRYADHFKVISPGVFLAMYATDNGEYKKKIRIEKNRERRRTVALASYHRNKKLKVKGIGRPRNDGTNLISSTTHDGIKVE